MDTARVGHVIPDCRCGTRLSACRTGLGLLDLWETLHNQPTTVHGGFQYHMAGYGGFSAGFDGFSRDFLGEGDLRETGSRDGGLFE